MLIKIKNYIFSILYVLVIIYLFTFVPLLWGYKPLVVISGSMEPSLKVGSILYYHEENISNFETKDILVYKNRNHIISHRISKKVDKGFITKGDANKNNDFNVITEKDILGKGTNWCIPFLGIYTDFVYTHKYLLFITVGILLIDLCYDSYYAHKKKVGRKYEKN